VAQLLNGNHEGRQTMVRMAATFRMESLAWKDSRTRKLIATVEFWIRPTALWGWIRVFPPGVPAQGFSL